MKQTENKRGFQAGWLQLRQLDLQTVKTEIMAVLGVTTDASFCNYKSGKLLPDMAEAAAIENIFKNHGVRRNIWGQGIEA